MIIDRIENIGRYTSIIKNSEALHSFFQSYHGETIPCGQHEVENTQIKVNVFSYETKIGSQTRWETHHEHMDIHIVFEGSEEIAWMPAQQITQSDEYVAQRDVEFFTDSVAGSRVLLQPGYFCLVLPEDAHKPALALNDQPLQGVKAVVKVEVFEQDRFCHHA